MSAIVHQVVEWTSSATGQQGAVVRVCPLHPRPQSLSRPGSSILVLVRSSSRLLGVGLLALFAEHDFFNTT